MALFYETPADNRRPLGSYRCCQKTWRRQQNGGCAASNLAGTYLVRPLGFKPWPRQLTAYLEIPIDFCLLNAARCAFKSGPSMYLTLVIQLNHVKLLPCASTIWQRSQRLRVEEAAFARRVSDRYPKPTASRRCSSSDEAGVQPPIRARLQW